MVTYRLLSGHMFCVPLKLIPEGAVSAIFSAHCPAVFQAGGTISLPAVTQLPHALAGCRAVSLVLALLYCCLLVASHFSRGS